VQYRPNQESATAAPRSGSMRAAPFQALMAAAADAVGCPSGPVRYVIRFPAMPAKANRSEISTPAVHQGRGGS
jgi:hypothetical protein